MKKNTKLNKILCLMLLIILFISNLFIGTPVKYNIMYLNFIVNAITLIYIFIHYIKEKEKININKIDACVIVIALSTFIPLIFNTYIRLADTIEYILRYITVLNIYMITKIVSKNNKQVVDRVLDIIIFSSIILIIFGIDMMTQNIFQRFYDILGIPKIINESIYRMGSLFKYPNTFGVFLVISILVSITRYINKENKNFKNIYVVALFIQMFALLMTYSRWSFLVLILALITLLLCIKDKNKRDDLIKILVASGISAGILYIIFNKILNSENYIWLYILLITQSIIFYVIIGYLERIKIRYNKKILLLIMSIFIIGLIIIVYSLVFCNNIELFKNINSKAVYRKQNILVEPNQSYVVEINIESSSNIKDNFKIQCKEINEYGEEIAIHEEWFDNYKGNININFITKEQTKTISLVFNSTKENSNGFLKVNEVKINGNEEKINYGIIPIELINRISKLNMDLSSFSGRLEYYKCSLEIIKDNFFTGAGGYAWKNSNQQTETNGIAEHSYPLQLFIQNGVISFIAYIVLIIIIIKNMIKILKNNGKFEEICIYLIILSLVLHSLFDFDMYFLNILIIFYMFIAIISSQDEDSGIILNHRYSYLYTIIIAVALYFSFGEAFTSLVGDKINSYNYIEAKIYMVPYDYTFRRDKINYLSTIKNANLNNYNKDALFNKNKEIIKEEKYIIHKEKNNNYDDINRIIINYIDIINTENESEILAEIDSNFNLLKEKKETVYSAMESRFNRKYFNENIEQFLEKIKEENDFSEESIDDNN